MFQNRPDSLRVLFIGNSYLSYRPIVNNERSRNGSYHQVVNVLSQAGIDVQPQIFSIGGGTLQEHWEEGSGADTARGHLSSGDYDLVIMQGRYDIHQNDANAERFRDYAGRFSSLAQQHDTRVVLFGLWATDSQISPAGDTFGPVAHAIYQSAAEQNQIAYAPNGQAYAMLYNRLANVNSEEQIENALTADQIHPTTALAYLAANVVLHTLLDGQNVSFSNDLPPDVSSEIGALIREVARESVNQFAFNGGDR
jgi:hypothetical protein